jgi:hypothetical protein
MLKIFSTVCYESDSPKVKKQALLQKDNLKHVQRNDQPSANSETISSMIDLEEGTLC